MAADRHPHRITAPKRSQSFVCAVAIGGVLGLFAAAQISGLTFCSGESQRREGRAFMAAIAIGLFFGLAARTPKVGLACLDRHGEGGFLGDMGGV